jgi:hypothetical protein
MHTEKRFLVGLLILLPIAAGFLPACKAKPPIASTQHSVALSPAGLALSPHPETLLSLDRPAYHAVVHLDGEVVYLLTDDAIFLLVPGQPPRGRKFDLGIVSAATRSAFIYWSKGALWSVPKSGGDPTRLGTVSRQPQYILAAGERISWIDRDEGGIYGIHTLAGGKSKQFYSTQNMVTAATMTANRIVFTEREKEGGFRISSVSLDGGPATISPPRQGRPPSMLAAFDNQIAYYDGNVYEVRLLAADLSNERVVGGDLICSPLALADRVYCSQVQGLFALSLLDHSITLLQPSEQSIVTAITADPRQVAYVLDVKGKLEVRRMTFR